VPRATAASRAAAARRKKRAEASAAPWTLNASIPQLEHAAPSKTRAAQSVRFHPPFAARAAPATGSDASIRRTASAAPFFRRSAEAAAAHPSGRATARPVRLLHRVSVTFPVREGREKSAKLCIPRYLRTGLRVARPTDVASLNRDEIGHRSTRHDAFAPSARLASSSVIGSRRNGSAELTCSSR
jgi:hypothetical protein